MPTNNPTARARMEASEGRRRIPRGHAAFRTARARAGLTQAAVAAAAGCSEGLVWRLERPEWISEVLATAIAEALGEHVDALFVAEDEAAS